MRHVVSYVFSSPLLLLPLSESLSESPRVSLLRYIILLSARRPLGTKGSTAVPDIAQNCAGRHPGAREYARQTTRRIGSNTRACSGGQLEITRSKKDTKDDAIKIMIMRLCIDPHVSSFTVQWHRNPWPLWGSSECAAVVCPHLASDNFTIRWMRSKAYAP